jgi:CheY-like chemotaxis protein
MMQVMDEAAVLKAVAANTEYRSIPVIVTSAPPEETVKECCGTVIAPWPTLLAST